MHACTHALCPGISPGLFFYKQMVVLDKAPWAGDTFRSVQESEQAKPAQAQCKNASIHARIRNPRPCIDDEPAKAGF